MSRSTLRPESLPGGRLARAAQAAAAAAPDTKPGKKTAAPAASKGSGEIRIIGGQWKRTRLAVAQRPGLRPTPDRVRETLFNWLGHGQAGAFPLPANDADFTRALGRCCGNGLVLGRALFASGNRGGGRCSLGFADLGVDGGGLQG